MRKVIASLTFLVLVLTRHQNAIKGITNLLNIRQTLNGLQLYNQAQNNAVAGQRETQYNIQLYTHSYNDVIVGQGEAQYDIPLYTQPYNDIIGSQTKVINFQDQSKIVSGSNLNLQAVRASSQALDKQGHNQLIPYGNLRAGSALDPVSTNENGAPESLKIQSWANYLSKANKDQFISSVLGLATELFPFNFLQVASGNMAAGTNIMKDVQLRRTCASTGAKQVTTGVVDAVRGDGFDLKGYDGKVYQIGVTPCTQLAANVPNFQVVSGAKAVVRGVFEQGVLGADVIICAS